MRSSALLLIAVSVAAAPAWAEPAAESQRDPHVSVRIGAATTDANGRPTICLEVAAVWRLSGEACGTGSGFLHREPGGEIAHFRAKVELHRVNYEQVTMRAQLGAGLAELQLDADEPGFRVGSTDPNGIETAGGEGSGSIQAIASLGRGFEAITSVTAGVAWFPAAGELAVPQSRLQPFASFDFGVAW